MWFRNELSSLAEVSLYSGIRWRSLVLTLPTKETFYKGLHTARIAIRLEPTTYILFNCMLIFHMNFKPRVIVQIYYFISVHWFKDLRNISMYLSFVITFLKMATKVLETCRSYTVCVVHFHTLKCTCWF